MPQALISLGSNQGDREATLRAAVAALEQTPGIHVLAVSRLIDTQPVGGPAGQSPFLNGAVRIETTLDPLALLHRLQAIEQQAGRVRTVRWAARTLDLDLLLHGDAIIRDPELQVPHPGLMFRRFVLEPAAEIAGDMVEPRLQWTVARLRQHLDQSPPWLFVVGSSAEAQAHFIAALQSTTAIPLRQLPSEACAANNNPGNAASPSSNWWVSSLKSAEAWQPQWPSPRLTFVLSPPATNVAWGPSLNLPAHDLSQAVILASAAISALLPAPPSVE